MKHNAKITIIIISLFFFAQIFGLLILNSYIDKEETLKTQNITYSSLPLNLEPPEVEQEFSYLWLTLGIIIATALVMILLKFKKLGLWKLWFGMAVFLGLTIAINSILAEKIAIVLAIILTYFKVIKRNIIVHNLTELFIYGGIAVVFIPVLNLRSVIILLIIISIYDMFAVWKSKHMVKLAKMQKKSGVFAGINIPHSTKKGKLNIPIFKKTKLKKTRKIKSAILGGGDIVFPMLFSGVIFQTLLFTHPTNIAFLKTAIISLTATIALSLFLIKSKKNKFYPAMPFLTAGCFLGYLIINLI